MKITFVKLRNFSNIYTALNKKELTIDFSSSKNTIILITGPNGSGKTSILSCLHPFAKNGNLDVRSENSPILLEKEGYKEIWYKDENDTYIIKHFYIPNKETHSVKSYIEKNGNELNPNGNVKSFEEIIKDELDIEPDYLKLVRLGNNVTNFIDHKATERKAFMGKILDDVDIFLRYFKKVTEKMRENKSIISHLVDKIDKLHIDVLSKSEEDLEILKENLNHLKDKLDSNNSKLSVIQYELDKYNPPLVVKEELDQTKKEMDKINKSLSKKEISTLTTEKCDEMILESNKRLGILETQLSSKLELQKNLLNELDGLLEELNSINKELNRIDNLSEIKETEDMVASLRERIEKRSKESHLSSMSFSYTKNELEDLIITMDKCNDILSNAYSFGKEPIKKALGLKENKIDIEDYVSEGKEKFSHNKLQSLTEKVYSELTKKYGFPKPGCKDPKGCRIYKFYNIISELATEKPDEIVEDDEFITYTKMASQSINLIIKYIKDKESIISKLPDNIKSIFTTKVIFSRILENQSICNKDILYSELSKVTEYELQEEDLKQLSNLKDKLKLLKSAVGSSDYFKTKKESTENKIDEIRDNLDSLMNEIKETKESIKEESDNLEDLVEYKDSISKKESTEEKLENLKESYDIIQKLLKERESELYARRETSFQIEKKEKELNELSFRISNYKQYTKDLSLYKEYYDYMDLVRSSLSSKEGIPLLYIKIYLKSIQDITNDLLDIVYDGDLFIENFNITADEFKIPYVTKDTTIKDVAYASQGERSFISLALSFALIYQSISRYNILLLDEIDATLDTTNREKFLQILEKQINKINGEQIFVISHNNMFNMYPVDVINMRNQEDSSNHLATYIKIR